MGSGMKIIPRIKFSGLMYKFSGLVYKFTGSAT